jgi:D-alanine-D-alanine ligase
MQREAEAHTLLFREPRQAAFGRPKEPTERFRETDRVFMKKLRVAVIFGGKSGEHEVSIASAASIFKHLDPARFEPVPIKIEKNGRWMLTGDVPKAISAAEVHRQAETTGLQPIDPTTTLTSGGIDVVFPVLHGPYGEDGTVQGLLELANVPYVGSGVLGSAVGMDKAVMKTAFLARRLPVGPYVVILRPEWTRDAAGATARVERELTFPVFVKPANLGSSVGISKAKNLAEFVDAMAMALQYDRKVVVEAAIPHAREIECAVLGNDDPQASIAGEIIPLREFYDYEAKYMDANGSRLEIPAVLSDDQAAEIQRLSIEAFRACDLSGLARVDFLMNRETGETFLNEVNTLPGFTTISMYPKLWAASGVSYPELLERLLTLALERHSEKQQLRTSVT